MNYFYICIKYEIVFGGKHRFIKGSILRLTFSTKKIKLKFSFANRDLVGYQFTIAEHRCYHMICHHGYKKSYKKKIRLITKITKITI